jgi:hypothetical protein
MASSSFSITLDSKFSTGSPSGLYDTTTNTRELLMDFDLVSAIVGAAVPVAIGVVIKYFPRVAAKTDNKFDDAVAAAVTDWLQDPKNAARVLEVVQGWATKVKP